MTGNAPADVWVEVCPIAELIPDVGVRALVSGTQVAVFKVAETFYAVDAVDPVTNAAVLSRGIVGDINGELVVASPIYKQHFRLTDGVCLEDESMKIDTYEVRVVDGILQVSPHARRAQ